MKSLLRTTWHTTSQDCRVSLRWPQLVCRMESTLITTSTSTPLLLLSLIERHLSREVTRIWIASKRSTLPVQEVPMSLQTSTKCMQSTSISTFTRMVALQTSRDLERRHWIAKVTVSMNWFRIQIIRFQFGLKKWNRWMFKLGTDQLSNFTRSTMVTVWWRHQSPTACSTQSCTRRKKDRTLSDSLAAQVQISLRYR